MGLLDSVMQNDGLGVFNTDEFGETATLRLPSGSTRSIVVIVDRTEPPTADEWNQGVREVMRVEVRNDSTYGVSATELDQGKHKIDLSYRPSETAKTYLLGAPISIDSAHLIFRVK